MDLTNNSIPQFNETNKYVIESKKMNLFKLFKFQVIAPVELL